MKINTTIFLWLIGIYSLGLIIFSGCKKQKKSKQVAQLHLKFIDKQKIGGEKKSQKQHFLIQPTEVRTDLKGNIFIADPGVSGIHVFDSSGHFQRIIGGEGKGPGEFTGLSTIAINNHDNLMAYDATNKRISVFSVSGNLLSSKIPPQKMMAWPYQVRQLATGSYLSLVKLRDVPNLKSTRQKILHATLFHRYNHSFGYQSSFGELDDIMGSSESNETKRLFMYSENPGYFCLSSNNRIWYAPGLYNGHIFKFKERPHNWVLSERIAGYSLPENPINSDYKGKGIWKVVTYGPQKTNVHSARINSEELGIFTLKDGRIINFSSQLHHGTRRTIVEIFNKKGELTGVGRLNKFNFSRKIAKVPIESLWKDKNDNFYFLSNQKTPVLNIGKIDGI